VVRAQASDLNPTHATRISSNTTNSSFNPGSVTFDTTGNIFISFDVNIIAGVNVNLYNSITSGGTIPLGLGTVWGTYLQLLSGRSAYIVKYDNTLTPQGLAVIQRTNATAGGDIFARGGILINTSGDIYYSISIDVLSTVSSFQIELTSFSNLTSTTINTSLFTTVSVPISSAFLIKFNNNLVIQNNGVTTISGITSAVTNRQAAPYGIAIDASNNIYLGVNYNEGTFTINSSNSSGPPNTVSVIPYANVTNVSPLLNSFNILLVKYNSSLQVQWATTLTSGANIITQGFRLCYDPVDDSVYTVGTFLNYSGYMNINNFSGVSGGNLVTTQYAQLVANAIATSTIQTSGFLVKYVA
jgi:hypothetical protein